MSKVPAAAAHPPLGTLIHDSTIQLVDVLGSGGYGVVFRGVDLSSKRRRKYAIKCMIKAKGRRNTHVRELNFHMSASGHPGIIEMYGAVEDDKFTYFIMEYATSNDLFHQILHESRYLGQDDMIKDVFLQLIDGVQHCHDGGVYHRDLKPENVMCFEGGTRVAITDFGLATSETSSCEFRTGSIYHMSPECQAGRYPEDAYSPRANDVWSLGIILLNMVTGRNPWKAATNTDTVYQGYLQNPSEFFSSVLPISRPLNTLLVQVLNPSWKSRMSLSQFRDAILDIPTFYSVNVHFEGNLARYCWEAGIKARTDLVDGLYGPVQKRPVPLPPILKSPLASKPPVTRKPVSPIHEEAKARPAEVPLPNLRRRTEQLAPVRPRVQPPNHHKVHRRPVPPSPRSPRSPQHVSPARDESMVSVPLEDNGKRHSSSGSSSNDAAGPSSSREDTSPSSSFPKTPGSSPQRVTIVKRRPRESSEIRSSPSYSPRLDDPMEFYGAEFCKRLAALPSDADDSDETDEAMLSPTSSQYSLHEARSWGSSVSHSRSDSSGEDISEIIRYPQIRTPERSKPIDIAGAHIRHPASPRPKQPPPPQPQYRLHHHHPSNPRLNGGFRHRRPAVPPLLPRPGGVARVSELRKVWEGLPMPMPNKTHAGMSPYERATAYASGNNGHWYH